MTGMRVMDGLALTEEPGFFGLAAPTTPAARLALADTYLSQRADDPDAYARRCVRYDAALGAMHSLGLAHTDTVVDVGAGWTEFGARLHTGRGPCCSPPCDAPGCVPPCGPSRARYIPVDACIDGVDLNTWLPPRRAEWFVALEVLEHLKRPERLARALMASASKGVIISTPNPATTDVLAMDATHVTPVAGMDLLSWGFHTVVPSSFYGEHADSLLAVWTP